MIRETLCAASTERYCALASPIEPRGWRPLKLTVRGQMPRYSRYCSLFYASTGSGAAPRFSGRYQMRVKLRQAVCILATWLLCGNASASPPEAEHMTRPSQVVLMNKLRICLNVDGAKAVSAAVVLSCPKKNVAGLTGISRADLFRGLGEPTGCSHADGSSESWNDNRCQDALDVYYMFWPPCKLGPGPAQQILFVLFSSAGSVTRSHWDEENRAWNGAGRCIP